MYLPYLHLGDWWHDLDDLFWWGGLSELRHAVLFLVHLAFAWFVYQDARRRPHLFLGTPPWLWGLLTLVIGVWGALAYWLANRSRWFQEAAETAAPQSPVPPSAPPGDR